MKLNPLWILLLLLVILILVILWVPSNYVFPKTASNASSVLNQLPGGKIPPSASPLSKEGFVSFMQDQQNLKFVNIPQYSASSSSAVLKLWDSLFFDTNNGNIIEIDGNTTDGNTNSSDDLGVSVSGIYIVQRNGKYNANKYVTKLDCSGNTSATAATVGVDPAISGNSSVSGTDCKVIPTTTNESQKYSLDKGNNLNSWYYATQSANTDKYLVLYMPFDILTFVHIINLTNNKNVVTYGFIGKDFSFSSPFNINDKVSISQSPDSNVDNNNGKMMIENQYDRNNPVYQISHTVKIDINNGYLIVNPSNPTFKFNVYDRTGRIVSDYVSKSNEINTTPFNTWIVPDGAGNMVLYIPLDNLTVVIIIVYDSNTGGFKTRDVCYFGNYKKQIYAIDPTQNRNGVPPIDLSNYMLKTEYVPPTCPSCPNCDPSSGVCGSCGGHGGSGTGEKNGDVEMGFGNAVGGVASGVGDVAEGVAKGAGYAVGGVASGVGSVVGGAENIAASLLSTNPANVKNINSGAPSAAPSTTSTSSPQKNTTTTPPIATNTGTIAGIDNYSYYGALVPKGDSTDFLPVTTSFSSFGK